MTDVNDNDKRLTPHRDGGLTEFLAAWPYEAEDSCPARWVVTPNGRKMLQLRIDIGVLQMAPDGRPDGTLPHGMDSLLAHYIAEEQRSPENVLPYKLSAEACGELQSEVSQYYQRLTAYRELEDALGVVNDSGHILDIIDLVGEYAEDDDDAWQFTQLYPQMLVLNTRGRVDLCRKAGDHAAERSIVELAISDLETYYREQYDAPPAPDAPPPKELADLRELQGEGEKQRPRSEAEALSEEIDEALRAENYERAANLRDQLNRLRSRGKGKGKGRLQDS
mgnify:CR=1 FL=1